MITIDKLEEALKNELGEGQFVVAKNKAGNRSLRPHPKTEWKKLNGKRIKSLPYTGKDDTTIRRAYRAYVLTFSRIEKEVLKMAIDDAGVMISRASETKTALNVQFKDPEASTATRYQEPKVRVRKVRGPKVPDHTPAALEKAIQLDPTLGVRFEEAFRAGKIAEATTILVDGYRRLYRDGNSEWFAEALAA